MTETIKIVRTKAFKVVMSKGEAINIDEEEVDGIVEGMNTGRVIIVKRGVINPSYLVAIIQDGERVSEWNKECGYGHGQGEAIRERGIKPLKSIFGETKIGKAIEAKQQQRLSEGAKIKRYAIKSRIRRAEEKAGVADSRLNLQPASLQGDEQ